MARSSIYVGLEIGTSKICVVVGEPLAPDWVAGVSDRELVETLQQRMQACLLDAERARCRSAAR